MKAVHASASRRAFLLLLALTLVLISAAGAYAQEVRLDSVEILPLYARVSAEEMFHDELWTAIVFYRPESCIPPGFNLLLGMDFDAAACTPMTVDGFIVWEEVDPQPLLINMHGLGAVPVWFVSWEEMQAEVADGQLTIGELAAMDSLMIGYAGNYQEMLQPASEDDFGMIELNAKGQMDDGRSFKVHVMWNSPEKPKVSIEFK